MILTIMLQQYNPSVCRPGGKIGLANRMPAGFVGQLFKTLGKYVPPVPGVQSPALWGTKEHVVTLFGARANISAETKHFVFRYTSPQHWIEMFRSYYGPMVKAFAAIDPRTKKRTLRETGAMQQLTAVSIEFFTHGENKEDGTVVHAFVMNHSNTAATPDRNGEFASHSVTAIRHDPPPT
jgi:hypothetical protein